MIEHLARRASQSVHILRLFVQFRRHIRKFGRKPSLGLIGARDGVLGVYGMLAKRGLLGVVGFEPDEQECKRIVALQPFAKYHPWALGHMDGSHAFHITQNPGCSSCLEPNDQVLSRYRAGVMFKPVRTTTIELRRFDSLFPDKVAVIPDFLQIDVQGFETRVLEGFGKHLAGVIGIECEAHLRQLYKDQALLWHLRDQLDQSDFVLRRIRTHGLYEGEMIETEVWFTRSEKGITPEQSSLRKLWEGMSFIPPPEEFNGTL